MAAWHAEFHLIPRHSVPARSDLAPASLENADWWAGAAFPTDYHRRLAEVAAPMSSIIPEHEVWGFEDGNHVDVWSQGGHVRRVKVLVDVRRLDSKFGAALLNFVHAAGAALIRRDGLIVEPTIGAYAAALRSSNAWKFASDPAAFVISLSKRDEEGP
jgi:hypothetical protein